MTEDGVDWFSEPIALVSNEKGQVLRFGLLALNGDMLRCKLAWGDEIRLATSYPVCADRYLGYSLPITTEYVGGCVEAELLDRPDDFDGAFELIQSGDSVRQNGLEIVEDDIETIKLMRIRTPFDW